MPQQTKMFRVFISSTFNDMKIERNLLREQVFPELEKLCRSNGARFQAIDLRWGVSEESQRNQKTMEICLNEIQRCQELSPKPNFLVLLGDRYGWQPVPAKIPETEMESLNPHLSSEAKSLIKKWYKLDLNAVPAEYVLQPWGERVAEYQDWEPIEKRLRDVLRNAALKAELDADALIKYTKSATHQEIIQGALNPPANVKNPEEHVFALSRTVNNLPNDEHAEGFIDLDEGKHDAYSHSQIELLKKQLKSKLNNNFVEYKVDWQDGSIRFDDKNGFIETDFVDRALNHLKRVIEEQLKDIVDEDELQMEIRYHREFAVSLTPHFTGRQSALDKIQNYLKNTHNQKVLSLIGASGSGKTSVMAKAIEQIESKNAVPVYRFIGANAKSSNLLSLLSSVCAQVAHAYDTTLENLAEEFQKEKLHEYNTLVDLFRKCLALATENKPLVLFLDALDQLSETDNALDLNWLPKEIPTHSRVIVSSLPELESKLQGTQIYQLPLIPQAEGEILLDNWFSAHKRQLTPEQKKEVLQKFGQTPLPLYLKLAFEQTRQWHSYEPQTNLPDNVPAIIEQFFSVLEKKHSSILVTKVVSYLLSGKDKGLTEDEILDMLVFDKEYWEYFLFHSHPAHRGEVESAGKLPVVVWSRLFMDLAPYFTERDSFGERLIGFYHRQFNEVLAHRYLSDSKPVHQKLAEYFLDKPAFLDRKRQKQSNVRKCVEQLWQIIRAELWNDLTGTISDLTFLEAKITAGLTFNLAIDFREALRALPAKNPERKKVTLLYEALRRDISFIARHAKDYPQALFQCFWNSCWWYDCPDTAKYYQVSEDGRKTPPPWKKSDPEMSQLLERWRKLRNHHHPDGFYWLRTLRPPAIHLNTEQKAVFRGHTWQVNSVAISPDGRTIVSGSGNTTLLVQNIETGEEIHRLRGHEESINSVAFSPDGKTIVSGSGNGIENQDNTLRVWCAESGEEIHCLRGHEESINSVAFSPDGKTIVSGSGNYLDNQDNTIRMWCAESGEELRCLRGHEGPVYSVAFSPGGKTIVSGSQDETLRLWNVENGEESLCIHCDDEEVRSVAFSPDGNTIVSSSHFIRGYGDVLRVWSAQTGEELSFLHGHEDIIRTLAFSPDGHFIVSGSEDKTVRVWNVRTGEELRCMRGHEAWVNCVAFSPDGKTIVSCSLDRTLRIWKSESVEELRRLIGHSHLITSVKFSPDERTIVSGSWDKTVRVWNARTGEELNCLHGPEYEVTSVSFSPNGKNIVSGSGFGGNFYKKDKVHVWKVETGEQRSMSGGNREVTSVAFSPNGRMIVSGSGDGTIRLWNEESGEEIHCLKGHKDVINCVAFSPDGKTIVSGSGHLGGNQDNTLRLWNAETGKEILCLIGHGDMVESVAFSSDSKTIISESSDNTLRVWNVETGECLKIIDSYDISEVARAKEQRLTWGVKSRRGELVIETINDGKPIAWFPDMLDKVVTHSSGVLWAGSFYSKLEIFILEGGQHLKEDNHQYLNSK